MADCLHEDWDYEDKTAGRARCLECGKSWFMSPDQIARVDKLEAEFEDEMNRGRPCIRCGNDLDTAPGGHVCGVTDEEWSRMLDDEMPF